MRITKRSHRYAALAVGLALIAASCGDDDDSGSSDTAAEATDTTAAEATETPAANSAKVKPRHTQETRNMLQQPRNAPKRGVCVNRAYNLKSSIWLKLTPPIRAIPVSGST